MSVSVTAIATMMITSEASRPHSWYLTLSRKVSGSGAIWGTLSCVMARLVVVATPPKNSHTKACGRDESCYITSLLLSNTGPTKTVLRISEGMPSLSTSSSGASEPSSPSSSASMSIWTSLLRLSLGGFDLRRV